MLGRVACHLCDFESAHVRRNAGKRAYVYCPNCGATTPTRNGHQEALLLAKTRTGQVATTPVPPPAAEPIAAAPPPAPAPPATPPKPPEKPAGLWDQLMRKSQ